MKRYLPLLMVILFPYLIVILPVLSHFTGGHLANIVFAGEGAVMLALWFFLYVIALVCSLITLIVCLVTKQNSQEMLHTVMVVKLTHLPAYIAIFIATLIFTYLDISSGSVFTGIFLSVGFMIAFASGLIGIGGLIRGCHEKRISISTAIIHGILQFVFLADIISSVFVCRKVKPIATIVKRGARKCP